MRFPFLNRLNKTTQTISTFGGINQNLVAGSNEFSDMKNISSRLYPAICNRENRGSVLQTVTTPNAMLYKNDLFWIDGTQAHYGNTTPFTVSSTLPKTVIGMGAYIIVFPDKIRFNTATSEVDYLESRFDNIAATTKIYADKYIGEFTPTNITISGSEAGTLAGAHEIVSLTETYIEIANNNYDTKTLEVNTSTSVSDFTINSEHHEGTTLVGGINWRHMDYSSVGSGTEYIVPNGKVLLEEEGELGFNVYDARTTLKIESHIPVTFAPAAIGSAYTKISCDGIGSKFKKNDTIHITGCSNDAYNGYHAIYLVDEDNDFIEVVGSLTKSFTVTTEMTFERLVPDMDYIIEKDNRLWGCSSDNHEIYSCKLGDATNWYQYDTTSGASYAATIATDGDFTGIGKFSSQIIFFKQNVAHVLRGDKPANFSITEKQMNGVKAGCDKSVITLNDTLFYYGDDGLYAFSGGTPEKISGAITDELTNVSCGTYENKLYVSGNIGIDTILYAYDTKTNLWHKEDDEYLKFPCSANGQLYFVDKSNRITTISGNRTERIDWMLESTDIDESSLDMKYISRIRLKFELDAGSEANVYISIDGAPWAKKNQIRSTIKKTYIIPIMPRRCSRYKIKIEGTGNFKLIAASRDVEGGSDRNGTIHSRFT